MKYHGPAFFIEDAKINSERRSRNFFVRRIFSFESTFWIFVKSTVYWLKMGMQGMNLASLKKNPAVSIVITSINNPQMEKNLQCYVICIKFYSFTFFILMEFSLWFSRFALCSYRQKNEINTCRCSLIFNALALSVDSALRLYWSWNAGSRLLCAASGHQKPRRYLEPQEQPRTMAGISWQAVQGEKVEKMIKKETARKKSIIASAGREIFGVANLEDFLLCHFYYHLMHHDIISRSLISFSFLF